MYGKHCMLYTVSLLNLAFNGKCTEKLLSQPIYFQHNYGGRAIGWEVKSPFKPNPKAYNLSCWVRFHLTFHNQEIRYREKVSKESPLAATADSPCALFVNWAISFTHKSQFALPRHRQVPEVEGEAKA